ncbi:diacylglycerol kinase family protein [Desulfallas thermosapovorans]|uniref:Diacylglycerol kinase (ATP) n=1 Tax=Desulfallas thermosapovorans DSM 6562 TaxID=1121431 RepID=A0A5S4ZW68_9FIRM|nr:diacylglycerol kinase family protein [Desulfallas thermosapovorans]TYO97268.1 diacylglycerol kinase (ATP) [Desulfallas thermosapovorans DSM 6562]
MFSLLRSFRWAISGILYAVSTQRNMKIHLLAALVAAAAGLYLKLPPGELVLLAVTIFMVLAAEMFNTALEAVVDLVSPRQHRLARIAKDVAAGAVLLTALNALVVAYLLIWPRLRV